MLQKSFYILLFYLTFTPKSSVSFIVLYYTSLDYLTYKTPLGFSVSKSPLSCPFLFLKFSFVSVFFKVEFHFRNCSSARDKKMLPVHSCIHDLYLYSAMLVGNYTFDNTQDLLAKRQNLISCNEFFTA